MKSLTAALILSTALAGLACADTTAPTFELHIALSDAAAAKLKESGEAITIAAYYYGDAKPGKENEVGQFDLGNQEKELAGAGSVDLGGITFKDADLANITGAPRVNINVFTARKVFEDNLIDCGFFEDDVAKAAAGIHLTCKLLTEG